MKVGDTLELKEPYEDKTYSFEVKSIYAYPGALAVFLPMDVFCEEFDHPEDYFNGYFSNEPITDLEESYIATKITEDDMTKISRQLNVSMGEMFQLINVFSIVLFMLLIYLLTKLIIEKNTTSISMVKILGYENREILSLYLTATTWVVIVSIGVSLIIASALIRLIYVIMLSEYSGWLTYYIDPAIYGKMYLMGLAAYAVIAVLQFRHIQKIPMDEALKKCRIKKVTGEILTSPGKVWYIALKLGVDFSTCNKVLFATQLSKADNCVAFLWAMEQSPCLHVSPPTEKITKGGNNERKLYERKASISTADFNGASNGNLDAGQFLI